MLIPLSIHPSATKDFQEVLSASEEAYKTWKGFVKRMKEDEAIQSRLLERDGKRFRDGLNITRWESEYRKNSNLWRAKLKIVTDVSLSKTLLERRLVYMYVYSNSFYKREFFILGLVKRSEFDYDSSDISKRIKRDYNQIISEG